MTHSMNGAVETRSNWKGLNAGLREVPSMAAMSFAAGVEGEDVRNTRERAWKSECWRVIRSPRRVPSNRHCHLKMIDCVALRWTAPRKFARKRVRDCVFASKRRAPSSLSGFNRTRVVSVSIS